METQYDSLRPKWRPAVYTFFYPILERVANKYGYALALHGSLREDMDLVAIPWIEDTGNIDDMLEEMHNELGCEVGYKYAKDFEPEDKPHGRVAYSIGTGSGSRIDLSIMPNLNPNTP